MLFCVEEGHNPFCLQVGSRSCLWRQGSLRFIDFGSQSCALSLCGRCSCQLTRVMRSCCQPGLADCCLSHTRIADSQPVTACRMLAASAATQSSTLQACTTAALSPCLPHLHLPACMAPRKPLSASAVQQQQDNSPSRPHKRKEISHAAAACSVTCATPSVFTLQLVLCISAAQRHLPHP
jgi:hypothetical protein